MYNECNTYDIFKNTLLILQNIKIKLLRNGIFFTKESIDDLISFFTLENYKIKLENLNNNIILIITPLLDFDCKQIKQVYESINNSIFKYLLSKINYLKNILTEQEISYISSVNNIKMLYSFENFANSLIIRI